MVRVPRRAVAGADVDEIQLGIVGNAVPRRAAAAGLPPLAVPGLRRRGERRIFKALRRIAGHDVELPRQLAGLRVVGAEEAAHAVFGAALADHAPCPSRCAARR